MIARIVIDKSENQSDESFDYDSYNFMPEVSISKPIYYGKESSPKIVLIDTGTKFSIIRNLLRIGFQVVRLPWDSSIDQVMVHNPAGVVLSNGPGDPIVCKETIETASELIENLSLLWAYV